MLFLKDLTERSVVGRKCRCKLRRSKRVRGDAQEAILAEKGDEILVYELKGDLFFGTTDTLSRDVESEVARSRHILFDLKRVRSIDITGAELIKRMANQIGDAGCELSICGINPSSGPEGITFQILAAHKFF